MSATGIDSEHFRARLLEERTRAATALEHLHAGNSGSLEDETDEMPSDNHLAEMASVTVDREIDYGLEENFEHELEAIDAALARIEDGTFGACQRCGQTIAAERLEALPYVTLCIDCKRLEERG
jgi:RNA polymerase-binding protein DksA